MTNLEAALKYSERGLSIIPVGKNKRPLLKWEPFQKARADEMQIKAWFKKWPNANIGIVTGEISGITVADADSDDAFNFLNEFLPDTFITPTAKTPKGKHIYFDYAKDFSNAVRLVSEIDIRNDGGYVVAPPSTNSEGVKYAWFESLGFSECMPQEMPQMLFDTLLQSFTQNSNKIDSISSSIEPNRYQQPTTQNNNDNILSKGRRDNDIFHVANCLVKGGMRKELIHKYLEILANSCTPPFPEKEIPIKINSALQRSQRRDGASMAELREWVLTTNGNFLTTKAQQELHLTTKEETKKLRVYLSRLVNEGVLEKHGERDGSFRKIQNDAPRIDILNAKSEYLDVKYPLELEEYYRTMQKNIILIAGTQDVGKTAFMLNMASLNMNRDLDIRYQTSEMGASELRSRCELFELPIEYWENVEFIENANNFQDYIIPDGINIIDFMEITDAFYLIGGMLSEIHNKLQKGIAVIALQKDFKNELGRGGTFSLEKPRLYVTLTANPPEGNIAKIVKCKNWANPSVNPNRKECVFKIIKGHRVEQQVRWSRHEGGSE